jgi:quercetin dioxygenase-like cupin family protein
MKVDLKRFDSPDEVRTFEKGYFEIVQLGGMTLGRATYQPGWKWSEHVGPDMGETSCHVEHVGLVISGEIAVTMDDGEKVIMKAGDLFHVPPGHDSWVVGDEPYVSLHFLGADVFYADKA